MKYISLLCVALLASQTVSTEYDELTKAKDIEIVQYGSQSSKDIRSIGRSYAYQLMKRQPFPDYISDLSGVMDDPSTGAVDYAKKYVGHVGVVGVGIILALFLFIGFIFSFCCMLCCNKSQKQTTTMAMWSMVWGAILIVLLAASSAGLLILALSASELTKLEDASTETIESLGNGLVGYLDETNAQIETIKTNQIEALFDTLDPLFDTAVSNSAIKVKVIEGLDPAITDIVEALTSLDTTVSDTKDKVKKIYNNLETLDTELTSVNSNIKTCKISFDKCDADSQSCYANAGLNTNAFDEGFDTASLKKTELKNIEDELGTVSTFGTPAESLAHWANFVQTEWDSLEKTIIDKAGSPKTEFNQLLVDAEQKLKDTLENDVQANIVKVRDQVSTGKDDYKTQITATIKYLKDVALLKNGDETDVPEAIVVILKNDAAKYVLFAIFLFVCILLGLVALTILIGLASTVLGCCKANNELLPTERTTGCCGNLLMCTSYCSVILCAIATLIAAILITVVMMEEGVCKEYNDDKLIESMKDITTDLGQGIDFDQMINDALKLDERFVLSDVMTNCKASKTLFTALNIKQETEIMGFSISSIKDEVDTQIDAFDVDGTLASVTINVEFLSSEDRGTLTTSKEDLTTNWESVDLRAVKTNLDNDVTPAGVNFNTLPGTIQDIINDAGSDPYDLTACKTAVEAINEAMAKPNGIITQTVDDVKGQLDRLIAVNPNPATAAATDIEKLIAALVVIDGKLTDTAIKAIIVEEVESVLVTAKDSLESFMDYMFGQFQTTILNCQPLAATYYTLMNYGCDGIFIHLTLVYCGLSLIGISLLFYMCISRCLARYFIKFSRLHPDDDDAGENGWTKDHSMVPLGAGNRVSKSSHVTHNTSRNKSARNGKRVLLISSPRPVPDLSDMELFDLISTGQPSPPTHPSLQPNHMVQIPVMVPTHRNNVLPPISGDIIDTSDSDF